MIGLVRRLATAPGFQRLTRVPALLRVSFALRALLVQERRRFAANELRRRPSTRVYRLRESGVAFALRHHTGDVMVLDEIFSQREYEPPRPFSLPPAPRVLDLGANIGLFGAWAFGRFPDASIVAVEADAENAEVHRRTIQANGLGDRWRLLEGFASNSEGSVRFAAGHHATSHAAEEGIEVPTLDVLPLLADSDLAKIDVEGAEWPILADPRLPEVLPPVVVLEYHGAVEPAEEALRAAGHEVVHAGRKPQFAAGLLWSFARADGPRRA